MYAVKEIFYTLQGEGAQTGRAAVFCRFAGCNLWSGREQDRSTAICQFCDTDFADTNGPGGGRFANARALAEAIDEKWRVRSLPGLKSETGGTRPESETNAGPSTRPPGGGLAQDDHLLTDAGPHSTPIASAISAQGRLSTAPSAAADGSAQDDRPLKKFVVCTGGEPLLQLDAALIETLHALDFEIAVETNGTIEAPSGIDWLCVSPKAGAELRQRSGDELKLIYPQPGAEPATFEGLHFRHFFLQPMDGPSRDVNTQAALRYCMQHPQWRLSLQTHKMLGIP